ncbi:hypothetical protein SDC9_162205 [bioreactor metagenome]|uniref:Uncharacterized protein n=1 Tax=bioreactor metagenome TaxID=1076179 RepID=A0A645FMI6_9ZZZZ
MRRHFGVAVEQGLTDVAHHGAGQADQFTRRAVIQPGTTQFCPAPILVLEIGPGQQFAQLAITRAVLADQHYPPGFVALDLVLDPGIHPNNGLDALAAGPLVELDHAKQIGQIGDAKRRHAICRRSRDGLIDLDDTVGDRVFGVQAEMDETWGMRGGGCGSHCAILPDRPHRRSKNHAPIKAAGWSTRWSCAPRGHDAPEPHPSVHSAD